MNPENLFRTLRIAVTVSLLFCTFPISAKTFFVEKWGSTDADCGTKSLPCLHIQDAIGNAGVNDRIVVGPGIYNEQLTVSTTGQKIESVAGRNGTFIDPISNINAVNLSGNKVRFGKKSKGFTVSNSTPSTNIGISITAAESVRVEGNRVEKHEAGIVVFGNKHQIRSNVIESNLAQGISCACTNTLFQDNRIENNQAEGIDLVNSTGNSVTRNTIRNNTASGIYASSNNANTKVKDNVLDANVGDGLNFQNASGGLFQGNIVSRSAFDGLEILLGGPSIKNNLAVGNGDAVNEEGFVLNGMVDAKIESNIAIQSGDDGILLQGTYLQRTFKNNNTFGSGSGCGINNMTVSAITYIRHFFGGSGGPFTGGDDVCGSPLPTGTVTNKPNRFKAKSAAKL